MVYSGELRSLVATMLAKEPKQRPGANDLLGAKLMFALNPIPEVEAEEKEASKAVMGLSSSFASMPSLPSYIGTESYIDEWDVAEKEEEPAKYGECYYLNGDRYVGEFKGGKFDGRGTFRWSNGERYEGTWSAGMKHGQGKLLRLDKDRNVLLA